MNEAELFEKLGSIGQSTKSAHARINEMNDLLVTVSLDVKELMRASDTAKGWKAGVIWFGGVAGAILGAASAATINFFLR